MNQINMNDTILTIVKAIPQARDVLVGLGFTPLKDDLALNTMGRVTTLKTAIKHLSLNKEDLVSAFKNIDVEVIDHE